MLWCTGSGGTIRTANQAASTAVALSAAFHVWVAASHVRLACELSGATHGRNEFAWEQNSRPNCFLYGHSSLPIELIFGLVGYQRALRSFLVHCEVSPSPGDR